MIVWEFFPIRPTVVVVEKHATAFNASVTILPSKNRQNNAASLVTSSYMVECQWTKKQDEPNLSETSKGWPFCPAQAGLQYILTLNRWLRKAKKKKEQKQGKEKVIGWKQWRTRQFMWRLRHSLGNLSYKSQMMPSAVKCKLPGTKCLPINRDLTLEIWSRPDKSVRTFGDRERKLQFWKT